MQYYKDIKSVIKFEYEVNSWRFASDKKQIESKEVSRLNFRIAELEAEVSDLKLEVKEKDNQILTLQEISQLCIKDAEVTREEMSKVQLDHLRLEDEIK